MSALPPTKAPALAPLTQPVKRVPVMYAGRRFGDQATADAERARYRKALLLQIKHQPEVWGYA